MGSKNPPRKTSEDNSPQRGFASEDNVKNPEEHNKLLGGNDTPADFAGWRDAQADRLESDVEAEQESWREAQRRKFENEFERWRGGSKPDKNQTRH